MSATLLGLAFRADCPSQSAKLVLLKLVDHCDDEGRKIFPSVAALARSALCSPRNVQRVMREFCNVGLLRRVKAGGSGPRSTSHYEMNLELLYRLGAEGAWAKIAGEARPVVEEGDEGDEAESGVESAASHDEGAYLDAGDGVGSAANKGDTVSPLETVRVTSATNKGDKLCHPNPQEETLNQRERMRVSAEEAGQQGNPASHAATAGHDGNAEPGASEGQSGEGLGEAAGGVTLEAFLKAYPDAGLDDLTKTASAWAELAFGDRKAALDGIKPYLQRLAARTKKHPLASWNYLRSRNWVLFDDVKAEKQAEEYITLPAWSRDWWIVLFRDIRAGRPFAFTVKRASDGHGVSIKLRDKPSAAEIAGVQAYLCDGPEMTAWRAWFRERRCWLPDFKGEMRVFLPSPMPPGHHAAAVEELAKAGLG